MRLFTEDDVLAILDVLQKRTNVPRLEVLIERAGVSPFEIEVPGGADQARAFAHWMKTGEIPDWRKEQIADEAVKEAVAEFSNSQTPGPEQHHVDHEDFTRAREEAKAPSLQAAQFEAIRTVLDKLFSPDDSLGPLTEDEMAAARRALTDLRAHRSEEITDPRELGGSIAGPGGPLDFGGVVLDTRRAILAERSEVAKIDPKQGARGNDDTFAVLVEGRINQSTDRATVMFLGDTDFLAALLTEIWGVCERASKDHLRALRERVEDRWFNMPHPS